MSSLPRIPSQSVTLSCATCERTFSAYPSAIKRGRKFCSRECATGNVPQQKKGAIWSREALARIAEGIKSRKQPKRKPDMVLTCVGCDHTFVVPGRKHCLAKRRQFCTKACYYAFIRQHPEISGMYRGGTGTKYGHGWREQAAKARARDNYTCQECGRTEREIGRALDVHHLIPRGKFDEDAATANVLTNLVTLCRSCHRRVENVAQEQARRM